MKVTIVCVTYLKENDKYLRLALESVKNQIFDDYELILVSSGDHVPQDIPKWVKHLHHKERHHYPEAVNSGFKLADPSSQYFFMMNDDVILTKNSLKNLVMTAGENDILLNPISNCDNGSKYSLVMGHQKHSEFNRLTQRFYRYDDLKDSFESLMSSDSIYPWGLILQDFICFYATLIPRKTWDKLGGLDPQFKTGQDDVDLSFRAKQMGIPAAFVLNSLIWHFGGATADLALTDEIRKSNIEYFSKKWGMLPP